MDLEHHHALVYVLDTLEGQQPRSAHGRFLPDSTESLLRVVPIVGSVLAF
jgi:hypothetical protein